MFQWISHQGLFPATWALKKDVPSRDLLKSCRRIDFGVHGIAWTISHGCKILMPDGRYMEIYKARLTTGDVIGPCDLMAMNGTKHEIAWRESFSAWRLSGRRLLC